jgi:polar amino acid transport system substrate-binding protein
VSRLRFTLASIAVAVSAALVLSACGSSGSSAGGQSGGSSDVPSQAVDNSLHSQLPASIQSAGVINFAVEQHPPYMTVNGTDITGPNIDLQNALAAVLGVKANSTVVGGGLSPVLAGLLSGRYDAFAGPVEATPDREKQYDETGWLIAETAYMVDKSGGSNSIDQLCGKTVTYVSGSVLEGYVNKLSTYCDSAGKGKINGLGLADTNATILAVKSGRAAGAGTTLDAGNAAVKADTSLGILIQPDSAGGVKENNCLITPKNTKLGPVLHEALQQLIDNGTYGKILAKWGLTGSAVKTSLLNPPLEAS